MFLISNFTSSLKLSQYFNKIINKFNKYFSSNSIFIIYLIVKKSNLSNNKN